PDGQIVLVVVNDETSDRSQSISGLTGSIAKIFEVSGSRDGTLKTTKTVNNGDLTYTFPKKSVTVIACQDGSGNLLSNPGFENNTQSWNFFGGGSEASNSPVVFGTKSFRMGHSNSNGLNQFISSDLKRNTEYVLSAYVYNSVNMYVDNNDFHYAISSPVENSVWRTVTLGFLSESDTALKVGFWSGSDDFNWVDDVALVEMTGNLLTNSGFESGSLSPWNGYGHNSGIINSSEVEGSRIFRMGKSSSNGLNTTVVGLNPNTRYLAIAWAKGSIWFRANSFGGPSVGVWTPDTGDFEQSSFQFETGVSNTSANIGFWEGDIANHTYVDDVWLLELGDLMEIL
ncbi:MAG: carbohydrate binding domain-containing protein, partial [Verrucomicrobiota bacterium]